MLRIELLFRCVRCVYNYFLRKIQNPGMSGKQAGQKHDKYPELVTSDRVHFVVLACEEGGRWGPDVFEVINDLVRLKVAPLHPLLRRSAALAYTRRWWSILAMGAQSAAIDCIFGRDPQVWVPHRPPPLATVLAEADIAPEPSRVV